MVALVWWITNLASQFWHKQTKNPVDWLSRTPSIIRSHHTNGWYSWSQTIYRRTCIKEHPLLSGQLSKSRKFLALLLTVIFYPYWTVTSKGVLSRQFCCCLVKTAVKLWPRTFFQTGKKHFCNHKRKISRDSPRESEPVFFFSGDISHSQWQNLKMLG